MAKAKKKARKVVIEALERLKPHHITALLHLSGKRWVNEDSMEGVTFRNSLDYLDSWGMARMQRRADVAMSKPDRQTYKWQLTRDGVDVRSELVKQGWYLEEV